jgi:RluA family pseudouridine synthase
MKHSQGRRPPSRSSAQGPSRAAAVTRVSRIAGVGENGRRLDDFLAAWLPEVLALEVSRAQVRKLISSGGVYVSSRQLTQPAYIVRQGSRVEAFVDVARLKSDATRNDRPFELTGSHILFEDEWLIAINKPPGLPTQATLDPTRPHLYGLLKSFLQERDGDHAYVGLHHRLDRDTSGVVLFTKKPEANAGVAELFVKHLAQKTYWALSGLVTDSPLLGFSSGHAWEVRNLLGRDPRAPSKKNRFASVRSGGDPAHTRFRLLESFGEIALIEARPLTGRTHQIRVHLSEQGAPILGDETYGGVGLDAEVRAPRLLLHAASLTFPHPISKLEISVESPIPEDFQECLKKLRSLHKGKSPR